MHEVEKGNRSESSAKIHCARVASDTDVTVAERGCARDRFGFWLRACFSFIFICLLPPFALCFAVPFAVPLPSPLINSPDIYNTLKLSLGRLPVCHILLNNDIDFPTTPPRNNRCHSGSHMCGVTNHQP